MFFFRRAVSRFTGARAGLEVLEELCVDVDVDSGRSYHYYGKRLLSKNEWRIFLGKCLLMQDLVDERYVGHQLVDGHCVLRLSASQIKPSIPRVTAQLI